MNVADRLLSSDEPSIQWKVRNRVFGESEYSLGELRAQIKESPRVRTLLSNRDESGRIRPVDHVYKKWKGAHWVFAHLADIGYPTGDPELIPIRDQVFDLWLSGIESVPIIDGRARRCASQQCNALYSAIALGLMDDRCHTLAELLMRWQWPDGGWNCDSRPEANKSSFWESLLPLRGLSAYAKATNNEQAKQAASRAAELFLSRRLYKRMSDGEVMNRQFVQLHYPCYWRYDILFGLKVMAEAGFIGDPRCADALDLLESKRLPDGGWPAEDRLYTVSKDYTSGTDRLAWGIVSPRRMNEWVTADALGVLKAAGR